jgi:hypothetical protein
VTRNLNPASSTAAEPRLATEIQERSRPSAAVGQDHSVITLSDDLLRGLIQAAEIMIEITKTSTNARAGAVSSRIALSPDEAAAGGLTLR